MAMTLYMPRPTVICLCPVKNESWILDRFLKCASAWADHIIVLDQLSNDGSRDIARRYSKVMLLDNSNLDFNEPERQAMLLEAARRIPGPRLLIALDADEVLSANFMNGLEWTNLLNAPASTVGFFKWENVAPDFTYCWLGGHGSSIPFAFMDDGSEHVGDVIHSRRVPTPPQAPEMHFQDIRVLHYQFTDWQRMRSKQRWYQCWERLNRPARSSIDIYRQYHHMDGITDAEKHPLCESWLRGYEQRGIDMRTVCSQSLSHWDREVILFFIQHGSAMFKREAVWDVDWVELAMRMMPEISDRNFADPRSWVDKAVHAWLQRTQSHLSKLSVRVVDKAIKMLGW